jgi:hypothetical protein
MPDDLQNEYMIERLRIAIERAEAAEDRVEELEAEIEKKDEAYSVLEGWVDDTAYAIWAEFKDKFEGERKYALRQIVKWLKGERDE